LLDGVHRNGANRKGTHSGPAGEEREQALFQATAIFWRLCIKELATHAVTVGPGLHERQLSSLFQKNFKKFLKVFQDPPLSNL
jgi:hypothetical protein